MKIVFVSHMYPAITETFTYNEVNVLKKEGLDVQVYSFKRPPLLNLTSEMKEAIKETIYFPFIFSLKIFMAQIYFLFLKPSRYLRLFFTVSFVKRQHFATLKLFLHNTVDFLRGVYLAFILKDKQELIHAHAQFIDNATTAAFICKKLLGINFSFGNHTRLKPALAYSKIKEAKFIICCSRFDKILLLSWSSREFEGKIYVNYTGVPNYREQEVIAEDNNTILSVGTLSDNKGYEFLIMACKILKDTGVKFHCVIVGDGEKRDILERNIEKFGLSNFVEITGYKSHAIVKKMMQENSIFVLPCIVVKYNDMDGIPVVLMEAMSFGKPCISTKISGIPELIEDDVNGLLVPQRDTIALARQMRLLLKDRELRMRLGSAARHKIDKDFNLEKNIRREADIFRKLEKEKASGEE